MSVGGYLTALLVVVSVTSLASALAAEGTTKKHVNFVLAVVVMVVLLSPLTTLFGEGAEIPDLFPDASDAENGVGDALLKAYEGEVQKHLCDKFTLLSEEVRVHIRGKIGNAGEVTPLEVAVVLCGAARGAREKIWLYLNETLDATCSIRVSIE